MPFVVNTDVQFKCAYCSAQFLRNCACKVHERYCTKNPNRKPTRNDIREIFTCQYCGRVKLTTKSVHTSHEIHCDKNPNRRLWAAPRIWTDDERSRLSASMKRAVQEGRSHGWASSKQNKNGMSYPEIWFANMLERNQIGMGYEYNKQFYKYKLDFAWVERRLCIEIDGSQHTLIDAQRQSDECKDALLHEHGWKVLRLKWGYICKNPQNVISLVKDFLMNMGDVTVPVYKTRAELVNEQHAEYESIGVLKNKIGRFNKFMISADELNRRKTMILESGIDLSKFGWVQRVASKTGLTLRTIYKVVERSPDLKCIVYRRKSAYSNNTQLTDDKKRSKFDKRLKMIMESGVDFQKRGWRKYLTEHTGLSVNAIIDTLNYYGSRFADRKGARNKIHNNMIGISGNNADKQ